MRYATAVRHLREIVDNAPNLAMPWMEEEPPLLEIYTFGTIFDQPEQMDAPELALVLNAPSSDLPWGAEPPWTLGIVQILGLTKSPTRWKFRPKDWPVWNHEIQRPVRLYSLSDGPAPDALQALSDRQVDDFRLPAPSPEEYQKQIDIELAAAWQHLCQVREDFWERDWRKEHKGYGIYPEQHLWNAVWGYTSLREAVGP